MGSFLSEQRLVHGWVFLGNSDPRSDSSHPPTMTIATVPCRCPRILWPSPRSTFATSTTSLFLPPSSSVSPASGSCQTTSRSSGGRTSPAAAWTPPCRTTTPRPRGTAGPSDRRSPACQLASRRSTAAPSRRAEGSSPSGSPTSSSSRGGSPSRWPTCWCLRSQRRECGQR